MRKTKPVYDLPRQEGNPKNRRHLCHPTTKIWMLTWINIEHLTYVFQDIYLSIISSPICFVEIAPRGLIALMILSQHVPSQSTK